MWTWNKTGEFSYPSLFHYYTNVKDNDVDFNVKKDLVDNIKLIGKDDDNLKKDKRNTVNSPMVGTFYASASPESKPFVTIGQSVKKGDTLCILEAMKMMNQVQAESDGKIVEILVDNAEPVEFDQPLFVLE